MGNIAEVLSDYFGVRSFLESTFISRLKIANAIRRERRTWQKSEVPYY